MKTTLVPALAALALAAAALHASARPAPAPSPAPIIDLKSVTTPAPVGEWYCTKMRDRCDNGDQQACALVARYCAD